MTLIFFSCQVTTTINNLIIGRVYCHHHGIMNISGNRNYSCKLTFKEQSFLDRNPRQVRNEQQLPIEANFPFSTHLILIYIALRKVQGVVKDFDGTKVATLMGKWDESMHCIIGDNASKVSSNGSHHGAGATLLWKKNEPAVNPTRYNLSSFAITLNELTPGLKVHLEYTINNHFSSVSSELERLKNHNAFPFPRKTFHQQIQGSDQINDTWRMGSMRRPILKNCVLRQGNEWLYIFSFFCIILFFS